MHEMRRLRDFYSLGVRQKALKLSDESNAEYGWTSFPGNKHRGGMDAADIGCTKRWEAAAPSSCAISTVWFSSSMRLCSSGIASKPCLPSNAVPEEPPSTLHVTGTVGLRRRLYHS